MGKGKWGKWEDGQKGNEVQDGEGGDVRGEEEGEQR